MILMILMILILIKPGDIAGCIKSYYNNNKGINCGLSVQKQVLGPSDSIEVSVVCYPCTQCNGCGKFDNAIFSYMKPIVRCLHCGVEVASDDVVCPACNMTLPLPPWQSSAAPVGRKAG
jgi:hypothetical protein